MGQIVGSMNRIPSSHVFSYDTVNEFVEATTCLSELLSTEEGQ